MKYFLLPLTLLLFAFADERKQPESPGLPWRIVSTQKDPAVNNEEALIEFRFLIDGSTAIQRNVVFSFNGIQDTAITSQSGVIELFVKPGKYRYQFFLDQSHYEVTTDSIEGKSGFRTILEIDFRNSEMLIEVDKPVIYLYPKDTTQVTVQLNFTGQLGFTWPQYTDGWNVTASPNGTLMSNGKAFDYLFWEGSTAINAAAFDLNTGYVVHRDTLADFFERTLTAMNLSSRERQDFITYWCPRMIKNEFNFIHFSTPEEYNTLATMDITPQPDEVFRLFMVWNKCDASDSATAEQKLPHVNREGFTVIEWGGAEISNNEL